jgi:chorismate synthase
MLRFLTAGESHGEALVAILDGLPAGLALSRDQIDLQLRKRQGGYGRGRRMAIEADRVEVLSGVRRGLTLGTPVALLIRNRDWVNWEWTMSVDEPPPESAGGAHRAPLTRPRPGHADLAGGLKHGHADLRNVLERASARETAARVAVGTCARVLLERFGVRIASHVTAIGPVRAARGWSPRLDEVLAALAAEGEGSDVLRCADPALKARMIAAIDEAKAAGDTLGGTFEVIAHGVPVGLGTYAQWDRRLDGRLAQALMSIPAIKAVEVGDGVASAFGPGSTVHDAILPAADAAAPARLVRPTNHAGGVEGGVSNGEDIRLIGYMKPIATLMAPLPSVDLTTGLAAEAGIERSDVCAVPAAAIVGEAVVALALADAFLESFGADSVDEIANRYQAWQQRLDGRFASAARQAGEDGPAR